jgi:ketosteroid isomerase-like protein
MDARSGYRAAPGTAPGAAVATMSHHLRWTDVEGRPGEWHSAWTAVFQRRADGWQIIYSHESTPPSPIH